MSFAGPSSTEQAEPNPFLDYRLEVRFESPSGRSITVPGFFAADGHAAQTSAEAGNVWRAHLTPWERGRWHWQASFRTGKGVAIGLTGGRPLCFDGAEGSFVVARSDKSGRDFRGKGLLAYAGERYLRFAGTGERFLKGGAGSPENFLAYADFDGTTGTHRYQPHERDWKPGDPQWKGRKGRGIIGVVNYLASKGANSQYFLTMNVAGDGNDVWPWTAPTEFTRFDVSKLDQWEILFSHMTARGVQLHVFLQELENVHLLDGGETGVHRKLYLRELVARFAHHPVLQWNIGEENNELTDAQRKAMADYLRAVDPYDHPQVVHTFPGSQDTIYRPLLGHPSFDGASIQARDWNEPHPVTIKWIDASARAGRPWAVSIDECCFGVHGALPDRVDPTDHHLPRSRTLWGNLVAGGAGAEHYFPGGMPEGDLTLEDFRTRDRLWDQTRYALEFFQRHLPFWDMAHADHLAINRNDAWVLASPGEIYAVYLPEGGTTVLDTEPSAAEHLDVLWYDPRNGGQLRPGSVAPVAVGDRLWLGVPPDEPQRDWVALVRRAGG
ncbi:MAG: DUF5060 domain-containing protein [Actinobacteria bacterium]|nr:DUF5060 domain-containing protein [Actinomycetota bacterium]